MKSVYLLNCLKQFTLLVCLMGLLVYCKNGSPVDTIQPPTGSSSATPTKVWDKTFGGTSTNYLYAMVATSDGGFLLGGYSNSGQDGNKSDPNRGREDFWVVKIDGSGNKVWDKTFGGSRSDLLYTMVGTSDGGFLLGGSSDSGQDGNKSDPNRGEGDFWVVKIDGSGNKVWDKTFGGSFGDYLTSVAATSDGGFLLGGYSGSGQTGNKSDPSRGGDYDYWVVKINGSGNKVWDKTFGGTNTDQLYSVAATSDGGFLLGGSSLSDQDGNKSDLYRGSRDYWAVKVDGSGNKVWDKTFGGRDYDHLTSVVTTSDGGFLLGGYSNSGQDGNKSDPNRGGLDYWVVKVDKNGTKVWDKTFGGSDSEYLYAVVGTSDGGFLLGGMSTSYQSGNKSEPSKGGGDYWVVKVDGNGGKVWDKTFGSTNNDYLRSVVVTSDGGFLLGGDTISGKAGDKSDPSRGNNDMWVVRIR
ncbi:T9SS C-terminal target domain-containing protein [Spirosoma endbachense]|uniref:T9SS C-terminal target domain-containing protein n=1 Tax=Spirosoma endbachense TaxID=2666025 RepID=A0A6P1W1D2_9BACT|nr:T9SS C-terminal target domain-containing protein [Spirosoma endbachense]QHV97800.1 T9SS C-terminal target domain-containing protein [Spirosoma endbachense]